MRALVVFESMFGNTETIARAVAGGLSGARGPGVDRVDVVEVAKAPAHLGREVAALIVGAPTHAFGLSRPGTRRSAGQQGAPGQRAAGPGLREWLDALSADSAGDVLTAAFDTRIRKPRLPGSAAVAAQKRLRRKGFRVLARAVSFFVEGTAGPLSGGEADRARAWGERLAAALPAVSPPLRRSPGRPVRG